MNVSGEHPHLSKIKKYSLLHTEYFLEETDHAGYFPVYDPGNQQKIGYISSACQNMTRKAIDNAEKAFLYWKSYLPKERAKIIRKWGELILKNREDLATLITLEEGKPYSESIGEVDYGADFAEWFAEEAKRTYGDWIPSHLKGSELVVKKQPIGVVAAITPWNFPLAMIVRKASAAMAAGCSVLVKPSPETPLTALALSELSREAGFPPHVFNVLNGDGPLIVNELCNHPAVKKLTFTGSTATGAKLYEMFAKNIKKVSMELGGHAPFILFADADLDHAVETAISAKFQTTGQDCLAANRIFIEECIYDDFCEKFTEKTQKLKCGYGLDEGVDLGPLINEQAIEKCKSQVKDALEKGAKILTGGETGNPGPLYHAPTVLTDISEDADILHEETFGPVAPLMKFKTEEEVIRKANDSEYGLISYICSGNSKKIWRISDQLESGMVACDTSKVTGSPIPFGGIKQSGMGIEGSKHGIYEFMNLKYICFGNLT